MLISSEKASEAIVFVKCKGARFMPIDIYLWINTFLKRTLKTYITIDSRQLSKINILK